MSRGQLLPIVNDQIQTYIVHVQKPEGSELLDDADRENWHRSFLPNSSLDTGEPRLLYSYRDVISGFAARLTPEEVRAMESAEGFVFAQPDRRHQVQTTHTPDFLGLRALSGGVWYPSLYGEGIIIGVLDTGIHPTHPSFKDNGMPPPPIKWNSTCNFPTSSCNNKLIGATGFYFGNTTTAEDVDGHGTHVASTAAGSFVANAHVLGMAKGTAAGMAPKAHLAMYKVCYSHGCDDSDTLAAIDQAIQDRVDVISVSIGKRVPIEIYSDYIIIGALAAVEKGIVPVVLAGNNGPAENSLAHDAPWAIVVGASTTDRAIRAIVKLGDRTEYYGQSGYQPAGFSNTWLPLAYPGKDDIAALYCENGTLDYIDVRGKIVLCLAGVIDDVERGQVVDAAGGAAMIIMNAQPYQYTVDAKAHVLPVSHVSAIDGEKIGYYVYNTNSTPIASIDFKGTVFGVRPAPTVAAFSSRGPSKMNGGILKPDVVAPGVNILAAWPTAVGPNPNPFATSTFNFRSGTSMATPHVSGVVALLKVKHPDWSPAKIQSAIITSAQAVDLDGKPIVDDAKYNGNASFFAMGAGHLNPAGAIDPGLVYDIRTDDYVGYLCGLGYTDYQVMTVVRRQVQCSSITAIDAPQLNYPSISVVLGSSTSTTTVTRTVTNVGEANSEYRASFDEPEGVAVYLSDYKLQFNRVDQEKSFDITFILKGASINGTVSEGQLSWVYNNHVVRSPIIVTFT